MYYKNFSYYYDKMMDDVCYDIFIDVAKNNISKEKTILDAGCGTGNVSIALALEGYNICGIDNSSDMLTICKRKMELNGVSFPLYDNDLEEVLPIEAFDAVISFLDVINYVDYKKTFKNIYNTLVKDGIFIFDINDYDYVESLKGYIEEDNYEEFSYIWKIVDNGPGSIIHDLTITSDETFNEKHYQTTYKNDVYKKELESLGFDVEILISDGVKTFFKCVKKA